MANTVKHTFVSGKSDGSDATKVQPSNWNAEHTFAGGALGSLLYRDTGASDGANWLADVAVGQVLVSGGVGAAPAWSATPSLTSLTYPLGTVLIEDAANTLAQRNGTNAQTFRVGIAAGYLALIGSADGSATIQTVAALPLYLGVNNAANWKIDAGHLLALGAYNIGDGAGNSPVNIYAEGFVDSVAYKVGGAAGVSFGPAAVTSITVVNGIVTAIS